MPKVVLKANESVDRALRRLKKKMDKEFGTKGAVFSLDAISAAEFVKNTLKEAAIYFAIKKTVGGVGKGSDANLITVPVVKLGKEDFYTFKGAKVNKDNWKGKSDEVASLESIKPIPCKACGGKGVINTSCKACKGTGKIQEKWKKFTKI